MSLYKDWTKLIEGQTQETYDDFWKTYSETETDIYSFILDHPKENFAGKIADLVDQFKAEPVFFFGFLDGIQSSLNNPIDIEDLALEDSIDFSIDWEKLYYNMLSADAFYLYELPQWPGILGEEKIAQITKEYKKSKTVVKEKKIGRNEPCPCGSGKKYKKCCGK